MLKEVEFEFHNSVPLMSVGCGVMSCGMIDEMTLHGDESASSSHNLRLSIEDAVRQGNLSEVARLAAEVVKFAQQGKTNEVRRLCFSAETDDFDKSSSSSMFDEMFPQNPSSGSNALTGSNASSVVDVEPNESRASAEEGRRTTHELELAQMQLHAAKLQAGLMALLTEYKRMGSVISPASSCTSIPALSLCSSQDLSGFVDENNQYINQEELMDCRSNSSSRSWTACPTPKRCSLMAQVEHSRLSLRGSFFHAMISYRAATEGASGNKLSFEIYEKIRELSTKDDTKIPQQYARGSWPRWAQKPEKYQPNQAKVFEMPWPDRECEDGDCEAAFVQALSSSMVLICLLSCNERGRGSLGDLMTLCPAEGKDRVDSMLLQIIVGLELRAFGEKTTLRAIMPILVGPQRPDSSFEPFPMGTLGLLSEVPSVMTNNRAASILARMGVGDKQIQAMQARSVRQHVDLMLKNQGVQAFKYANQNALVRESARRCLMVIKREIFHLRTHPANFARNRPAGQEVLDWLNEKGLRDYIRIFVHYGLDNLLRVSKLSRKEVSRLTEEYGDVCSVHDEQESPSPALSRSDFRQAGGYTSERDGTIALELSIWKAISTLEDDPRARKMAERLEWFEDSAAAWHCRVWAKNCVERWMEIQIIFIILSAISLNNLMEMQKKYVTSSDYCKECYIHRIEEFLSLLWLANLRNLGYNGRTISKYFARICLAVAVRKGFWLGLLCLVYGQPGKYEEVIEIVHNMLAAFAASCLVKYRPEYFSAYFFGVLCIRLGVSSAGSSVVSCRHLDDLIDSSDELLDSSKWMIASLIIFFLALYVGFWQSFYRVVVCRKAILGIKATEEASRLRDAWVECDERNPDHVTELAKLCKRITLCLEQQREEALQMLPWYLKVQAYLEERVGRWSFRCKARQNTIDLDLLMENAGAMNESFQDLVSEIGFNGCSVNRSAGLEFVAGPVKQPMRTLEKLVRRYRRDVGCLTDLVRCTVMADSLGNVRDFIQLLYTMSVVGLDASFEEEGKGSRLRVGGQLDAGDEIFRITALKNRFDPSYADETSMRHGYRGLTLNVEVGWLMSSDMVSFQKVRDWRRLNCTTHICEIQVRTRAIHEGPVHKVTTL